MSPNLNALDLMGMKGTKKQKFSWRTLEVEKEVMKKSLSFKTIKTETTKKPKVKLTKTKPEMPVYEAKSLVIDTFESRQEFFGSEVSQLLGWVLLAFSVILLLCGL